MAQWFQRKSLEKKNCGRQTDIKWVVRDLKSSPEQYVQLNAKNNPLKIYQYKINVSKQI